jgi:hypothetical protein
MHRRFLLVYSSLSDGGLTLSTPDAAGGRRFGEITGIPLQTLIVNYRKPHVCALRRDLGLLTKPQPEMMEEACPAATAPWHTHPQPLNENEGPDHDRPRLVFMLGLGVG